MHLPTTDVQICNLALDLLKETPITITALADATTNKVEALCARWYPVELYGLLEQFNWNFSRVAAAIQRAGTPSISDYSDYYQLPNDYLRLRAIIDEDIPLSRRRFAIEGRYLLYDNDEDASLDIWYTKKVTDVTLFPALFTDLLAHRLAVRLGKRLTAKPSIMADIKNDLKELQLAARAADGQIKPPKKYESSRIVNVGLFPQTKRTVAGDYEFDFEAN